MNIILYSTGCPKCNVLKKKLDMAKIEYEICEDEDVMEQKGFMSAPMLEVDEVVMDFGLAVKWIAERTNN